MEVLLLEVLKQLDCDSYHKDESGGLVGVVRGRSALARIAARLKVRANNHVGGYPAGRKTADQMRVPTPPPPQPDHGLIGEREKPREKQPKAGFGQPGSWER